MSLVNQGKPDRDRSELLTYPHFGVTTPSRILWENYTTLFYTCQERILKEFSVFDANLAILADLLPLWGIYLALNGSDLLICNRIGPDSVALFPKTYFDLDILCR